MQIPVHRSTVRKGCVLAFFPWLQATQIFPHIVFGCKDKGFMGIWYTTGKVLTKKHAYYCKISIFAKKCADIPSPHSHNRFYIVNFKNSIQQISIKPLDILPFIIRKHISLYRNMHFILIVHNLYQNIPGLLVPEKIICTLAAIGTTLKSLHTL